MKVFKKILKIVFVVACVFSVLLNVALCFSTTNNLAFKDNSYSRFKIYANAANKLSYSESFTVVSENAYGENQKSKDTISCYLDEESITKSFICSQISQLYENDGTLIRTSYFPGDGYKYSIEGETKAKTAYSNASLSNYFTSVISGANTGLYFIAIDYIDANQAKYLTFDTKLSFDFKSFSLLKEITADYKNGANEYKVTCTFDKSDNLIKLVIGENSTLEISYKKTNLQFPSFEGYVG